MIAWEPIAFGVLALTPAQFRRMTPGEVYAMHDGYEARLTAPGGLPWLAAILLQLAGSPLPWTAHTVLGRPDPKE